MCITIPGKVIKKEKQSAAVEVNGRRIQVSLSVTPEAKKGDWVLVYGNLALRKIPEREAKKIINELPK